MLTIITIINHFYGHHYQHNHRLKISTIDNVRSIITTLAIFTQPPIIIDKMFGGSALKGLLPACHLMALGDVGGPG